MTADLSAQPLDLDAVRARAAMVAARRHYWARESGIADADVIADLRRAKELAVDDVPALLAEVERLRQLVGDENQPGWEGCSRAEAIRQAESFHASVMEWKREHDARRDERDEARAEVERLHELRDAAVAWRVQFSKPAESKPPRMAALIAAVDKLTEGSGR